MSVLGTSEFRNFARQSRDTEDQRYLGHSRDPTHEGQNRYNTSAY